MKRIMDIYHIFSAPMYFDMDTEEVIKGTSAIELRQQLKEIEPGEWETIDDPVRIGIYDIKLSGRVYHL